MKNIYNFFLKNYNYKSQVDYDKSKILLIILLVSLVLTVLLSLSYLVTNIFMNLTGTLPVVGFAILSLYLMRRGKVVLVGNIATMFISIFLAASAILNFSNQVPFNFLMEEYYTLLFAILFSAMFASRVVFVINSSIVVISAFVAFFAAKAEFPANILALSETSFLVYIINVILIFLLAFFFTKFINTSVKSLSENADKIKKQNSQMSQVAKEVKISAEKLSLASVKLNSVSKEISQSTNEQSTTTEEIASSMEEMVAILDSNTEKAEQTGEISSKMAEETKKSSDILQQTIKSVSEISTKISIIAEIADKTDILSINAAIESARAGAEGKGFSVVAQEIRKLADKTKVASNEIDSISKSGQDISKIAGKKLTQLIPEILKSAEYVKEIVLASKEQQSGIETINDSVQHLTEITNKNSVAAEEMSASAEELAEQAELLKELISVLNNE